jgi:hypothetical protein
MAVTTGRGRLSSLLAVALAGLVIALAASIATVATAATATSADLRVSLRTKSEHPHAAKLIKFTATTRNAGPDSTDGFKVSLTASGGLHGLKLVSAPPDEFTVAPGPNCPTLFGEPIPCVAKTVAPKCHSTGTSLTCSYDSKSPFLKTSGDDASLEIVVSAHTGTAKTERLQASVSSSTPDPKPSNNHASLKLEVTH